MRQQQKIRSCRQQPREYLFTGALGAAGELISGLSQPLDRDAVFYLREIVPVDNFSGPYRYRLYDPARMALSSDLIDPFVQILDPVVPYPPGGSIMLDALPTNGGTTVEFLFRGVNEFIDYRAPEEDGPAANCLEVPRTHLIQVAYTDFLQLWQDQTCYLDEDCEFELRQATAGVLGQDYQFADRDRMFIQSTLIPNGFDSPKVYDPAIRYPKGGQIVVNCRGSVPDRTTLKLIGVNRYRVDQLE